MSNVEQLEQLVGQLMSPDNNSRNHAESTFNELKKNPDVLIITLTQLLRSSQHEPVRKLATILLRRVLNKGSDSLWPLISAQTQETVKAQLLAALQSEKAAEVRSALADAVGHIGSIVLEKGSQWNELLPFMFNATKSEDEAQRESAIAIFSDLAGSIGEKLRPYFNVLKDVLAAGLNDKSLRVRLASLDAAANFLHALNEPHERATFQQLTPLMLGTIGSALNEKNEEDARGAVEIFVELAEIDPTFLRPHLAMTINAMLQISTHTGLEDETKNLALEFLITLAENKPSMIRKYPKFLESVLPVVLNMMTQLDEDVIEWNNTKEEEDDDIDISNSDIGEESLDRLAISLGGKLMVPALFSILPSMLSNSDWRYRHTGLMSISIIGEGCHKLLTPNLPDVIKNILPFFNDAHPRVRWASCNTVGQMSTDFGPEFQSLFHASVVPALISVMDDKDNPRVQSHAASAIINFCEHCQPSLLAPYLDALLSKLLSLLQTGKTIVQEQAITAIAAIADCAESYFGKYYDTFMPLLKTVLMNAPLSKEYRLLRGKAMECISLIGVAVGKDKFLQDAKDVMELMMKTQTATLDNDDPQVSFLLQSWARICRCLGYDFVPYLPAVMPPLLASAKIAPDVKVSELDEDEVNAEGWDFIPVGDKRIGIHTSGLEEKSTACNMLFCYASELKDGFFPYVEEVAKILVPLLKFYYHDGVRSAAVSTMPHLLTSASEYLKKNAAKGADAQYVRNLLNFMYPSFLESLREEIDLEILLSSIQAFAESIAVAGVDALTEQQIKAGVELIKELYEDVKERRQERIDKQKEEDHDDEEEEKIEDEAERDDEIISSIGELIGHFAKYNKTIFLPLFANELLPIVLEFLKPTSKPTDRQAALCIFDDLAEFCGDSAFPFYQHFLPSAIAYITDADASVRQAAVYGMGCAAQSGGDQISPAIPDILNRLSQIISASDARSDKYVMATENAIGAVGKICVYQSKVLDQSKVIPMWLTMLPVKEDAIESKVTYGNLLTLIESSNPYVLGQNFATLPHILSIFAEILETELVDEPLTGRIKNVLKTIQTSIPADVLQKVWTSLNSSQQQKLQKTMSS